MALRWTASASASWLIGGLAGGGRREDWESAALPPLERLPGQAPPANGAPPAKGGVMPPLWKRPLRSTTVIVASPTFISRDVSAELLPADWRELHLAAPAIDVAEHGVRRARPAERGHGQLQRLVAAG